MAMGLHNSDVKNPLLRWVDQRLPVVSINGMPPLPAAMPIPAPSFTPNYSNNPSANPGADSDIFASIEKLAALQSRGILSEHEYASKKAELLSRL